MSDADEIARFVAERGVTVCPVGYAAETQAALDVAVVVRKRGRRLKRWVLGGKNARNAKMFDRRALDILRNRTS